MLFDKKRSACLVVFLIFGCPAQAQLRGMPEAVPAPPAAPMAMPAPLGAPDLGSSAAPITSAPSLKPGVDIPDAAPAAAVPDTTAAVPATAPTTMVPGCPDGPDCQPEPKGERRFNETVKEMSKEFAKCEAEGKSLVTCLFDNPPPPNLSQLSEDDRMRLMQCLGSSNLSATKARWSACLVGAD